MPVLNECVFFKYHLGWIANLNDLHYKRSFPNRNDDKGADELFCNPIPPNHQLNIDFC